tara:strand:+ start:5093 stop:5272 length:180 start_codon:yes stop_codon:yes gene_type:complete
MPYEVKKVGKNYKLYKLKEKKYVKTNYKSKQSAINSAINFMNYRNENPVVRGNKIVSKS